MKRNGMKCKLLTASVRKITVQECVLHRVSLKANWVTVMVPTNRRNETVLSTWIIIMRKKEWTLLFFLSSPLLWCTSLMLHKCPFYSMIFSLWKCETLRFATVLWNSCSQNFLCLFSAAASDLTNAILRIWNMNMRSSSNSTVKTSISWGSLRKKSIKCPLLVVSEFSSDFLLCYKQTSCIFRVCLDYSTK